MPTPAVIPRSPFVPRTDQSPYSHVEKSTRAELDRLGLTALRAMVDEEPYGSSNLGGAVEILPSVRMSIYDVCFTLRG